MADHPHAGHRQRVYDRFALEGLGAFADHEALELVLFYAIPRQDVNPLAHSLVERFGSFAGVLEAPREELAKVPGMTPRAALLVSLLLPCFRFYASRRADQTVLLDTSAKVIDYARAVMTAVNREVFVLLCLDSRCRLIRRHEFGGGTPNEILVHPRAVVEAALLSDAVQVVFIHNHPSGEKTPSKQDRQYTARLAQALRILGIELLDHVITGQDGCYSFLTEGDLDAIRSEITPKG